MSEDDVDFGELVKLSGQELRRRFEEDPASLPGTFVIKLWLDGNKAILHGDSPSEEEAGPEPDVLELVQSPGLPVERKHELLVAERLKAINRVTAIERALEDLND